MENTDLKLKTSRNLKNFYLDPNNYRFIDKEGYQYVAPDDILDPKIQQRTRNFLEGKHKEGIQDLLDSFRSNGFLKVDVIQLKTLGSNNFLVLEGNRRVTALKVLQEEYNKGYDIGKLDPKIFASVPSEIHDNESPTDHLIIMGLKHISGNKTWPAINQAKLIYDYLSPFWKSPEYIVKENELCESLGITMYKLRNSQRAYHFILQYKESDFGDQFKSEKYAIFEETTKKPTIKSWLGWDEDDYRAKSSSNVDRFFKWISQYEEYGEEYDEGYETKVIEPIISRSIEIRDLSKFIDDEHALAVMEDDGSVAQALYESGNIDKVNYEKSLKELEKNINELDRLKDLLSPEDIGDLKHSSDKLIDILPKESVLDIQGEDISVCFEKGRIEHFEYIEIENYKIFNNFKLEKLNRINILAGYNNTGKTSLLEAIYLLTKQNNMSAFFEMIRLKNKLDKLNTSYLQDYFHNHIKIKGVFNHTETEVSFEKFSAKDIDKKDDYLSSYKAISSIDGVQLDNITHTFEFNPIQRYYDKIEVLCQSIFKSPFFYNKDEIINTHSKNVELKVFDMIIEFLKEHVDNKINDIDLTERNHIKRFLVDSKAFDRSVDITSYGEGIQRIFEISLAFAYCKNGVLLLDELETAIHYSLLVDFTRFIQELAVKFNVQLFVTSHSKECIDAFLHNEFENKDISAYLLENINGTITYKNVQGDRFKYLIDNINLDLRGEEHE